MKLFRFVTISLLIFLVAGCDDFSLYSQFTRDKEIVEIPGIPTDPTDPTDPTAPLVFELAATTLTSGNSVEVSIVNGTPPYALVKKDLDVYSSGSPSIDLGTFTETQYTAGKSCGTIELKVIDSAGTSFAHTVTVKPRPVEGLIAVRNDKHHTLTWDFPVENMAYIEKFEIQEVEGYNKSSVPKHPKINITRYQDEKVRQRI